MTFNELLTTIEQSGHKHLADKLYEYILVSFKTPDVENAAQMITDMIVDWKPEPVFAESWVMSTDFAYAQNFAALMRAKGILPPPTPVDLDEGFEIVIDV